MTRPESQIHPLADIFPEMPEDEYAGLKDDIRLHGQIEPVWTLGGQIVDGRHRLRACLDLGLTPNLEEIPNGTDPLSFVMSKNFHRRHLTQGQKAAVAAEMVRLTPNLECSVDETVSRVADMMGVSKSYVYESRRIAQGAPDLGARIRSGELSIPEAQERFREREVASPIFEATALLLRKGITESEWTERVYRSVEEDHRRARLSLVEIILLCNRRMGQLISEGQWHNSLQPAETARAQGLARMTEDEFTQYVEREIQAERQRPNLDTIREALEAVNPENMGGLLP